MQGAQTAGTAHADNQSARAGGGQHRSQAGAVAARRGGPCPARACAFHAPAAAAATAAASAAAGSRRLHRCLPCTNHHCSKSHHLSLSAVLVAGGEAGLPPCNMHVCTSKRFFLCESARLTKGCALVLAGSTVLRPGFLVWPPLSAPMPFGQPLAGPGQAPRDDAGGPRQGETSGGPWLPEGQPLAPGPHAGSGGFGAPWPSSLPDGWLRSESLGSSMLSGAAAIGDPLALGLRSLSTSGLSSQSQFGVIHGLDGQYLRLTSFSSQSSPRLPPIANLPWADNQQLQARSSSCSALPGGPVVVAVEPPGGPPEGQPLLRWRSGSYPPDQQLHLPAHADVRQLVRLGCSAPDNLPPLPHDVHGLDPFDFEGLPLWADLE